ncbi:MAG: 3-dehydroquinate synthase [Clostridia bacterium]|nr:3-dehydroquinate synthase [Clostridia bacterium]
MRQIRVNLNGGYDIFIGDTLSGIKDFLTDSSKVLVVTDENVLGCCKMPAEAFEGAETFTFVMSPGENNKNLDTYREILKTLADNGFTREDKIVAFGGGVVGDTAAFAAATYLRGIKYISVPTTLLAMIDSSVGGKAAVNFEGYKNYVGAFCQPQAVFINTDYLDTLDEKEYRNGLGEGLKYYALIGDSVDLPLYAEKEKLEDFIYDCLSYKSMIVEKDEKDSFERKILNLGHTLGHAIEEDSGYEISHGEAVANGVLMMAESSFRAFRMSRNDIEKIRNAFIKTGIEKVGFSSVDDIRKYVSKDKKIAADGDIDAVLINAPGECGISRMSIDSFIDYVAESAVYNPYSDN